MKRFAWATVLLGAVAAGAQGQEVAAWRQAVANRIKAKTLAVIGREGFVFYGPDLRSLTVGPFWGASAAKANVSADPRYADPTEAIVDFHQQLKALGIELVLVPVPAKAAVRPSLVVPVKAGERVDAAHAEFYKMLSNRGVNVVDLVPVFRRSANGDALYCRTDTHWSGEGARLAAQTITSMLADRDWAKAVKRRPFETETRTVRIKGDLLAMLDTPPVVDEAVKLHFVGEKRGDKLVPPAIDPKSPILVIGDSHALVFSDPELHAEGAGFCDHLAHGFGVRVDRHAVRGSGATVPRLQIYRRRDALVGKKLVVWVFAARAFTESDTGWRKLPVMRKKPE